MRAIVFVLAALPALMPACSHDRMERAEIPGVVDVTALRRVSPGAEHDLKAMLEVRRSQLSACADPWRPAVALGSPGSVGVVMRVTGTRDGALSVRPQGSSRLGPAFDACVWDALRESTTRSTGDYDLAVRVWLCIRARRP